MDNNETIDMVFKQLDLIEKSIKDTIKLWNTKLVPTNLIKKDAEEMGVTQIPMELFSAHIDVIKSSFQKAAKEV